MKEIPFEIVNTETGEVESSSARTADTPAELNAILSGKKFPVPPVCTALWTDADWKKWIDSHQEKKTYCESCGEETTGEKTIRTWACSSSCYADIMGIDFPDY